MKARSRTIFIEPPFGASPGTPGTRPKSEHEPPTFGGTLLTIPTLPTPSRASPPESDAYLRLKHFVASHPACLGLPHRLPTGETEHFFPSGDCIDVLFRCENEWIGVAVKTALASETDLQRSLFQCVKYQGLMKAERLCRGENSDHLRVFLVLASGSGELENSTTCAGP